MSDPKGKPVEIDDAPPEPVPNKGAGRNNETPKQTTGHPTKGRPT